MIMQDTSSLLVPGTNTEAVFISEIAVDYWDWTLHLEVSIMKAE